MIDYNLGPDISIARRQGEWVSAVVYEDIPDKTLLVAKCCLLDFLGVAIKGSTLSQSRPARLLAESMGINVRGGTTVIGGGRAPPSYAAYANGTFGHSLEYDDFHIDCGHPGVCVIPAALATAELSNASGRDLLTAIVAGYQAMVWSIAPIHRRTLELGWHGTKVGGPFGAAAVTAKLLRLDPHQIAEALAIAASEASGSMEYDQSGGEVKRIHAGSASRAGFQAAFLAQAGLTGPKEVFEGLRGIYRLFSCNSTYHLAKYWTGRFHIDDVMFKLYPSAGSTHAALDAFGALMTRHSIMPDSIEAVDVETVDWSVSHGATIYEPVDVIGAQFSLAFGIALLAVTGENRLEDYSNPARWRDPAMLAMARRVTPISAPVPEGASELFARVRVSLKNGQEFAEYQPAPRGYPSNPAAHDELVRKFRSITEGILLSSDQDALQSLVDRLENVSSLEPLFAILERVSVTA